jgi:uncharacterized membrane protein YkvA (DUF1232 family)
VTIGEVGAALVRRRAEQYASDPRKLLDLAREAAEKARASDGPLGKVWDELATLLRMLRAYATGEYREVPWKTLVLVIGAVVYFVVPFDLVPDFIAGVGLLDDAAVIAWTVKSVRGDVASFCIWEEKRGANREPV